jgi:hypothetical protein
MLDRAPKRPWADVLTPTRTRGGCTTVFWSGGRGQGNNTDQDRTVAEADMEIIRTKRALTTLAAASALSSGGGGTGGGKNKYRKRSMSLSICLSTLCFVNCGSSTRRLLASVILAIFGRRRSGDGDRIDVVQCLWIACVMPFFYGGGVGKLVLINLSFSLQRLCKARAEAQQGTCQWGNAVDATHRHGDVTRECEN